jgi:hypothetical protein
MAALLRPSIGSGDSWPERRWLPMGLFGLWMAGTAVHLYCLGYVYDFNVRAELLTPAIWVLLWVGYQRRNEIAALTNPNWERALLIAPIVASLGACSPAGSKVFLALTLLGAAIYGAIFFYQREQRLALHLLLLSVAALASGVLETWRSGIFPRFTLVTCLRGALGAYLMLWVVRSRNPKLGILGALAAAGVAATADNPDAGHWGLQAGLCFLLLHSLRWCDLEHTGATTLRFIVSAVWIVHSFAWVHFGGTAWMTVSAGVFVLATYLVAKFIEGSWASMVVPIAAAVVLLSGPGNYLVNKLQSIPMGLAAVAGSFLLFGAGTAVALTRHRWHKQSGMTS